VSRAWPNVSRVVRPVCRYRKGIVTRPAANVRRRFAGPGGYSRFGDGDPEVYGHARVEVCNESAGKLSAKWPKMNRSSQTWPVSIVTLVLPILCERTNVLRRENVFLFFLERFRVRVITQRGHAYRSTGNVRTVRSRQFHPTHRVQFTFI